MPEILWDYRTTTKTPIEHTPFALTYRMEIVILIELSIPMTRVAEYDPTENEAAQAASLILIDELREEANIRNEAYKKDTTKYHDKRFG